MPLPAFQNPRDRGPTSGQGAERFAEHLRARYLQHTRRAVPAELTLLRLLAGETGGARHWHTAITLRPVVHLHSGKPVTLHTVTVEREETQTRTATVLSELRRENTRVVERLLERETRYAPPAFRAEERMRASAAPSEQPGAPDRKASISPVRLPGVLRKAAPSPPEAPTQARSLVKAPEPAAQATILQRGNQQAPPRANDVLNPLELKRITEHVMDTIGHRVAAERERRGRK